MDQEANNEDTDDEETEDEDEPEEQRLLGNIGHTRSVYGSSSTATAYIL